MNFELGVILKTTVLFACSSFVILALRRASASTRHAVWALAFWAALALPAVSMVIPAVELPVLPTEEAPAKAELPVVLSVPFTIPVSASLPARAPTPPVRPWTWRDVLIMAWSLGALVFLFRAFWGAWEVHRLRHRSVPAQVAIWTNCMHELQREMAITKPIELLSGGDAVPPMTWGVFRQVVLMPNAAKNWTTDRFQSVLAHELAHAKRGDGLTQILVQAVCSFYWFNPLVWYAAHRIRIERERACDDQVLKLGVDPDDYADHLLQIARDVNSRFSFATVSIAHPSQLESRLLAILNPNTRRQTLSRIAGGTLCATIALLTASVAAIQLTALARLTPPAFVSHLVPEMTPQAGPPAPAAQNPSADGTLQGRVVRVGTTEGLSKATVELLPADVPSLSDLDFNPARFEFAKTRTAYFSAMTNDRGEFSFERVPAGRYRIESRRDRFHLSAAVAVIDLQPGASERNVVVPMTPAAAITGVVRDEGERPVAYAVVSALGVSYRPGGGRSLHLVESVETNDLGEYRLYGLGPDEYYIAVDNSDSAMRDATVRRQNLVPAEKRYPVFYYPDTPELGAAKAVRVRDTGQDASGIDIHLRQVPLVTVRGTLQIIGTDSTTPVPQVNLIFTPSLFPDASPGYRYQADSAGKFEIKDVAPGSYLLNAWSTQRTPNAPSMHSPMVRVDVGNKDLEGLTLPVVAGPTIVGRLKLDGATGPLPFDTAAVLVKFVGRVGQGIGFYAFDGFNGIIFADGSYSTARGAGSYPGDFDITVQGLPPGFYLKEPLTLQIPSSGVAASMTLDLTLARHNGAATGIVTGADGRPVAGANVVLAPSEKFARRADRFPRASTDSEGRFRIASAPPGDYVAYAFENIAGDNQYNPDFLQTYFGRGTRISIVENGNVSANLRLIPQEKQ